jgi:Ribbon-helix-helix protein, copG family
MKSMVRTQVNLDEDEYERAKREARLLGISIAEFVRRAVRQALPPEGEPPWMKYAGMVDSGDPHSSQHIDDVIYGPDDIYGAKD